MAGPGWDPSQYGPHPTTTTSTTAQYPPATSPSPALKQKADDEGSVRLRDRTWNTAFGPVGLKTFAQKKYIKWYIIIILISIGAALLTIFHKQIVNGLRPFATDLQKMKFGWLIPVAILFVISFPPLFGHEIITVLCGLVWGLWKGFGIVALGTLLGELGNFYLFKYACTKRSQKQESTDINYACMCLIVREGGFWIAFLARLSAIPGHLVTPVFATTGMSLFIFLAATILSLPKQLAAVYVGTLFETDTTKEPLSSKIVEYVVLAVAVIVTVVAMWYIYRRMAQRRPEVERMWAEKRAARLAEEGVALPTLLDDDARPSSAKRRSFFDRFTGRHPSHGVQAGEKLDGDGEAEGVKAGLVGHAAAPGYAGLGVDSSSTVDLHLDDHPAHDPFDPNRFGPDRKGVYQTPLDQFPSSTAVGEMPAAIEYVPGPARELEERPAHGPKPNRPGRPPPSSFAAASSSSRQNTAGTVVASTRSGTREGTMPPSRGATREGTRAGSVPMIPPPPPLSAVSPTDGWNSVLNRSGAEGGPSSAYTAEPEAVSAAQAAAGSGGAEAEEYYRRKSVTPTPDEVVASARARTDDRRRDATGREGSARPPKFAPVDPGA